MSKARAFIDIKLHIPAKKLDEALVRKHYQKRLYKEDICKKCPEYEYRHSDVCQACPKGAYIAHIKMWDKVEVKGKEYITLPAGNLGLVEKRLGFDVSKIDDQRVVHKVKCDLKFTGKLYTGQVINGEQKEDQVRLKNTWMKYKTGLIIARPRTGKTILGTAIACELNCNTLITASQNEFLDRFEEEFEQFTNYKKLQKKGQKVLLRVNNLKDLKKAPKYRIVLCNYQKFIHPKSQYKVAKYLWNRSFVMVDEAHQGNAAAFAKFLNALPCKYRLGLTATPKRVDRLHIIVERILGPIRVKGTGSAILPIIKLWETKFGGGKDYKKPWMTDRFLLDETNERNRKIIQQVFKDLRKDDKHSILIACSQRKHVEWLTNTINAQAKYNNKNKGEHWQTNLAAKYYQGVSKQTLINAKNFEHRVIVAIINKVKFGLNVPAWTHVYVGIKPTSNGPNFFQLSNRVCTMYKDKPNPIVRLMVDHVPMSVFCARKLWFTEILPSLKDRPSEPQRYRMSDKDYRRMMDIAKFPKSYNPADAKKKKEIEAKRFF